MLVNSLQLVSQNIGVPLSHWAYDAIERWEIQGYIDAVYNGSRPFTRREIADYINTTWKYYQDNPEKFSRTDIQQLHYLTLEFQEELLRKKLPNAYTQWRSRLNNIFNSKSLKQLNKVLYPNYRNFIHLHYKEFNLSADPVLSYSKQQKVDVETGENYTLSRISNGLLFYGNLGNYFGFYFDLTDNHLSDQRYQNEKIPYQVWEEAGWPYLTRRDNGDFEFDENVAYLTFDYKYFFLAYGREYNQWGIGHTGNVLLSSNAQLYDQVKFIIRYWRFKYTHITAFLQYISPEARESIKSQSHIDQYWSGNRLEINIGRGIQLGLSEAVIYGDRSLQIGYLNPLSFFKSIEHYYGDRDNGILGIDLEWRMVSGLKIYAEWFIDDITTTKLGTDWYGNKFAYQLGFFIVNPFTLKDIDFMVEYDRIEPYVYTHTYMDYNKYKHYDTILGHYITPNSDHLFLRLRKRLSKFLEIGTDFETHRHGSNLEERNVGGDPDRPFQSGDSPNAKFLDGIRKDQKTYGLFLRYEFIRNLFLELDYRQFELKPYGWQSLLTFRLSFNLGYRDEKFQHIFPATY
jgi:hypothetical protein